MDISNFIWFIIFRFSCITVAVFEIFWIPITFITLCKSHDLHTWKIDRRRILRSYLANHIFILAVALFYLTFFIAKNPVLSPF